MRSSVIGLWVVAGICWAPARAEAQPEIMYVDHDAAPGGNGVTWDLAYRCLQDALAASTYYDEIWVAEGVYRPDQSEHGHATPGDRNATFAPRDGLLLIGGFAGYGAPDPNARDVTLYPAILSGDLAGDDGPGFANNGENSYHVVSALGRGPHSLDGFIVRAGNNTGSTSPGLGAGIYALSYVQLVDCTIADNCGGGIYAHGGSLLIDCRVRGNLGNGVDTWAFEAQNCAFTHNTGTAVISPPPDHFMCSDSVFLANGEGAINAGSPVLTRCVVSGNCGGYTGGVYARSTCELEDCVITGNVGTTGGGIRIPFKLVGVRLSNTVICGNQATDGGGLHMTAEIAYLIQGCTISGNVASSDGGGIYDGGCNVEGMLINTLLVRNTAARGGAAFLRGEASLQGCSIAENAAGVGGGVACDTGSPGYGSIVTMANCILWNEGAEIWINDGSQVAVTYSDVEGGWPGTGNIDAPPMYVAGDTGMWTADAVYDVDAVQVTFFDDAANWTPGALVRQTINPDTTQPLEFAIAANTATTITIWADYGTVAAGSSAIHAGASYRIPNYRLDTSSPCIDAGDGNAAARDTWDIDEDQCRTEWLPDVYGLHRVYDDPATPNTGGAVDMGAAEYGSRPPFPGECPADCNCDGHVTWRDIDYFVTAMNDNVAAWEAMFAPGSPTCPYNNNDANGDGAVTWRDIDPFVAMMNRAGP